MLIRADISVIAGVLCFIIGIVSFFRGSLAIVLAFLILAGVLVAVGLWLRAVRA